MTRCRFRLPQLGYGDRVQIGCERDSFFTHVKEDSALEPVANVGTLSARHVPPTLDDWVAVVIVLGVAALWCSLWAYVGYERRRAVSLFTEASRVRVGDTEASILPLLGHHGGHKWMTEPLPPKEQWIDKDEYDYQVNRVSDYSYVLGISPFGTSSSSA